MIDINNTLKILQRIANSHTDTVGMTLILLVILVLYLHYNY